MTREELDKLTDILDSEVLGNFMHGGEAAEVIAMFEDKVEESGILKEEPAEWSEEDKSHIRYLIECLEFCKKGVALTMTTSTAQEYINWLKSLKPQSQWKPSEEQLEAVSNATALNEEQGAALFSLYQDLKKL